MTARTATWISRSLLVLAIGALVATWIISARTAAHPVTAPVVVGDPTIADGPEVLRHIEEAIAAGSVTNPTALSLGTAAAAAILLLWIVTGSLIVSKQPKNLAGWVFAVIGTSWMVEGLCVALTLWGTLGDGHVPVQGLFAIVGDNALLPFVLLPLLFLLFPDGRAPAHWRWVVWTMFAGVALVVIGYVFGPGPLNNYVDAGLLYVNPIGVDALEGTFGAITGVGAIVTLISALATVPAVRGRYKRATGDTKQQLRWLVAIATLTGVLLLLGLVLTLVPWGLPDDAPVFPILLVALVVVVMIGIPAAYLIAIFRHGLWDLDVVIKKALIALVLGLLLAVIGLAAVAIVGQFALWRGTPRTQTVAVGIAIGLLVVPTLRLSRRIANRLVYGRRSTPYEVLSTFSSRVGETYSIDDVLPRMAQILAEATGATVARVWLRVGNALRHEASWPTDAPASPDLPMPRNDIPELVGETVVEVRDRGDLLGALSLQMPASEPMDPSKERLVEDLASQAGLVLRNVRLIEELRASRQRLLAAQNEERRRIERNLHDGVQQQLVALNIQLGLLARVSAQEPAKASEMAAQLQSRASEALEDLRDLARGIYPPLLADKGLAAALEGQARKAAVPTTVDAAEIARYPQEVESAVYFCTLEALNNVAKYANASAAWVSLARSNGHLVFTVSDDGRGFDPSATGYGTGLQGMADRLDAVGGQLEVQSSPGGGTRIIGSIRATPEAT